MNKKLFSLLPWLLACLLVAFLLRTVPLTETWAALRLLDAGELWLLAMLNIGVLVTLNGRWWSLLRGLGVRVPFGPLLGYRLAAFGVSYFTPGPHFGGEPVQVLLIERRHGVPRATAVASVALDKTIELLVNFTFLAAGLLWVVQGQLFHWAAGAETAVFALLLCLVPVGVLGAVWRGKRPFSRLIRPWRRLSGSPRWRRWWQRLEQGVHTSETQMSHACQQAPGMIILSLSLSIVSWLLMMVEYGLTLYFLGLTLTPVQVVGLLVAARIAILLPLPGALGTLEASQVGALGLLGMETAVGLSISLVIRARDVLLGLIGLWLGSRVWRTDRLQSASKSNTM